MRTDAQSRIISLSFKRDPKEHAEVMLEAGRRLMTSRRPGNAWLLLVGAITFGAAVGLAMEGYRRFVLSALYGMEDVTPLNIVVLQFLPLFVLLLALFYGWMRHLSRRRKQALIDRLEPNLFVDVDVFGEGIRIAAGGLMVDLEWRAMRDVLVAKGRVEFESESFTTYIPERAFAGRKAFEAAARQIRTLWLEAKDKQ